MEQTLVGSCGQKHALASLRSWTRVAGHGIGPSVAFPTSEQANRRCRKSTEMMPELALTRNTIYIYTYIYIYIYNHIHIHIYIASRGIELLPLFDNQGHFSDC